MIMRQEAGTYTANQQQQFSVLVSTSNLYLNFPVLVLSSNYYQFFLLPVPRDTPYFLILVIDYIAGSLILLMNVFQKLQEIAVFSEYSENSDQCFFTFFSPFLFKLRFFFSNQAFSQHEESWKHNGNGYVEKQRILIPLYMKIKCECLLLTYRGFQTE